MQIVRYFIGGFLSALQVTSAPLLYRYPYRNSAEGLHADWRNIGQDIESVMGRLKAEADRGR